MRKFISTVALAVVLAGAGASVASATVGTGKFTSRATIGTGSNTAAVAGFTGANLGPSTFTISGSQSLSCPDVDFRITSVTTTTALFDASYGPGCTASVGGLTTPVVVDVGCPWALTATNSVFNDSTGAATNITVDLPCATVVTVPALSCQITVSAGTRHQVTSQNVTSSGANDTSTSPFGVKLTPEVTLPFTSNCALVPASGHAAYAGQVYVRNVWGML